MKGLSEDWITKDLIDFEYKKYKLLAYLQEVQSYFDDKKLYPVLADLVAHYRNLILFKENKEAVFNQFPKKLNKADFENLKLHYEKLVEDDEMMEELNDILSFAIPKIKTALNNGKEIYEFVESRMSLHPVGISPLYAKEGYLLLQERYKVETKIFRFGMTVFTNADENYRALYLTPVDEVKKGLGTTYEQIKLDLIRRYKDMPNPATYLLEVALGFPFEETVMPIAKRQLVRELMGNAA